MTRNDIMTINPQIKTITNLVITVEEYKNLWGEKCTSEKFNSEETKFDIKSDFNFVIWRSRKSNMGIMLYEGALVAFYTKEDAMNLARILNNNSGDTYSVRKVA